jgi:hypothetical protein
MEIHADENDVSLLDPLILVAENLGLLILGPLFIGLAALGIGYVLPQSFTSQAILTPPVEIQAQAAAIMVSPLVLDSVIESVKLSHSDSMQQARARLERRIKAAAAKDGLLRIDVTANSPAEAQSIANAVIDAWLKSTVPGPQDRADLEKRLAFAKASLESVRRLQDQLITEGAVPLVKSLTRGEAGASIVAIGELQSRYLGEVLNIPRQLTGLTRDVVKQPPTLPTEPVAPKKSFIVVLSVFGSGVALLLWVFMRQAWKIGEQDPQTAEKQAKLRAAIGMNPRRVEGAVKGSDL